MTTATPFYRTIMLAIEDRRAQLGLPLWKVDELAGTQDGHLAKCIHADAPSGRQAQWRTLQLIVDALWPEGFCLKIEAAPIEAVVDAATMKRKLRHITANYNPKTRRELMAEIGKKGREIQMQLQTPEQRSRIARKAARNRWRRAREERRNKAKVPATSSTEKGAHAADTSPAKAPRAPAPGNRPTHSAGIAAP